MELIRKNNTASANIPFTQRDSGSCVKGTTISHVYTIIGGWATIVFRQPPHEAEKDLTDGTFFTLQNILLLGISLKLQKNVPIQ